MKKLIYTIGILLFTYSAIAQNLTDALRYSNYKISGTARAAAMGNAFGALGADFTSLSINPAGVAVYRSGEFTFTPSMGKTDIDGTYLGNKVNDSKYNVSVNNIGYVATIPAGSSSESGVVSFSIGLGFNRLGGFSMSSLAEGNNSNNSILGYFTDNANNGNYSDYYEDLAARTNLIFTQNNGPYQNDITNANYKQSQRKTTDRSGYINEYLISFGSNFNHKFYLGATVGIHDVYFKETQNLYEWDANNNIPYFNNLNFYDFLKTTGTGFNLKIGAIYKPTENLRLGIAFHTPTFYKLNDEYDSRMESSITYDDGVTENLTAQPDKIGIYDYEIETPMKTILSGAYVIGKLGLISVDYEIVDYSSAKLKNGSDGEGFYSQNQTINNAFKTVGNLHVGGEFRVNNNFSLRAGYENYPSAYRSRYTDAEDQISVQSPNSNASYSTIAGGFGFKQGNIFFDAAVKHVISDQYLNLYPDSPEMAKYDTKQNSIIFTLGYKF